jgi:hypothetical protein
VRVKEVDWMSDENPVKESLDQGIHRASHEAGADPPRKVISANSTENAQP